MSEETKYYLMRFEQDLGHTLLRSLVDYVSSTGNGSVEIFIWDIKYGWIFQEETLFKSKTYPNIRRVLIACDLDLPDHLMEITTEELEVFKHNVV